MNLPKSVISFLERARYPSSQSVQEMRTKMPAAMMLFQSLLKAAFIPNHSGQGARSAATNTGTSRMRVMVMMFDGVQSFWFSDCFASLTKAPFLPFRT